MRNTFETDQGLTPEQYTELIGYLDKVPASETLWQYVRSPDWLVHHRWPTIATALSFVPEMFTFGRWQREKSGAYNWIWKWLGVSPAAVSTAGIPWAAFNTIEALVAGQALDRAVISGIFNTFIHPLPYGVTPVGVLMSPVVWMIGASWALTWVDKFRKFTTRDYDGQKLYEAQQRPQH